jgi:hypothetical protein
MTARLDERQAKSFPEKVGDFHCLLAEAMGVAGTFLPHNYWNLSAIVYSMIAKIGR